MMEPPAQPPTTAEWLTAGICCCSLFWARVLTAHETSPKFPARSRSTEDETRRGWHTIDSRLQATRTHFPCCLKVSIQPLLNLHLLKDGPPFTFAPNFLTFPRSIIYLLSHYRLFSLIPPIQILALFLRVVSPSPVVAAQVHGAIWIEASGPWMTGKGFLHR